jgi:phosphomannomutase
MHKFDSSIFREYDIRGVYGKTLHDEDAYWIGRAYTSMLPENARICVAYDGRHSSPALAARLIDGLTDSGVEVLNLGLGPTPMAYFGVFHLQTDGAIMVTASHNPPADNGFKFMLGKDAMFGAQICSLAAGCSSLVASRLGNVEIVDIRDKYINRITSDLRLASRDYKIAYDAANGAMGEMVAEIAPKISTKNFVINAEIDGDFPAHPADPTKLANNKQLIDLVLQNGCDIGFGFDGDGDRLGIIDDKGRMLAGDQILAILARDVLAENAGATIIADVKSSRLFEQEITRLGGKPMLWKTGHSLIKAKMKELNAPLAGEMSAHIFFADNNGYDDALYAAIRFLNVMNSSGLKASELLDALPQMHSSPEFRLACPEERKFVIIEEIKAELDAAGANYSAIDGVRVNQESGWWLLRASNTGAEIVARCEGNSAAELQLQLERLKSLLSKYGIEI